MVVNGYKNLFFIKSFWAFCEKAVIFFLIGIINDTIQNLSPEKDKAEYEGMESWTLGFSKASIGCILFTSKKLYEKTTTTV